MSAINVIDLTVTHNAEDVTLGLEFCQDKRLRWYVDGKQVQGTQSYENVFDAFIGLSQKHLDFTTGDMMKVAEECGISDDGESTPRFVIFTPNPDHRNNGRIYLDRAEASKAVEASFMAGNVGFTGWGTDDPREEAIGIDGDPADADHGLIVEI